MVSSDESLALSLLEEHDSILKKHIFNQQGHIIKHIGDAVFAEFENINDSISAAIEIQKELKHRNKISRGKNKINIRIGLHYGHVIEKENDLFGHDVNICARIEGHAFIGGIAISNQALNKAQIDNYFTRSYGHVKLKNISQAIEIFKIYTDKDDFLSENVDSFNRYIQNKGMSIVDIDSYVEENIISISPLYPQNLGSSSDDFFCYSFLEQILSDLRKVNSLRIPNIFEIQKFKNSEASLAEVSRRLNVENILQTSVIKNDKNIRINIEVLSIKTGDIVLQETIDATFNELVKMSGRITLLILDCFSIDAPDVLKSSLDVSLDVNEDAYKYFLEAKYIFNHIKEPTDLQKSTKLLQKSIELDDNFAESHAGLGFNYHNSGQFDDAEEEFDLAEEISLDNKDYKSLSIVYNYKASFYRQNKKYKKAIRFFEKALKYQKEVQDEITEANILHNMSGCLADSKINEYDKAFQLLDRSKEVYKRYEMYSYLANTYAEIGNASKNLNMFSKTLENYEKAKQYFFKEEMSYNIIRISIVISDIYNQLGLSEIAREHIKPIMDSALLFKDQIVLGRIESALSKTYEIEFKYDIAIEHLEKARSYYNHLDKNNLMAPCLIDLSYLYYLYGDAVKAHSFINQAQSILDTRLTNNNLSFNCKALLFLYKKEDESTLDELNIFLDEVKSKNYYQPYRILYKVYNQKKDQKKADECKEEWNQYVNKLANNITNPDQKNSYLNNSLIA